MHPVRQYFAHLFPSQLLLEKVTLHRANARDVPHSSSAGLTIQDSVFWFIFNILNQQLEPGKQIYRSLCQSNNPQSRTYRKNLSHIGFRDLGQYLPFRANLASKTASFSLLRPAASSTLPA